jgi:hypothetical protein
MRPGAVSGKQWGEWRCFDLEMWNELWHCMVRHIMEKLLQTHRLLSGYSHRHIFCLRCRQRHSLLPLILSTHRCTVEHEHIPRARAPLANITRVVRM